MNNIPYYDIAKHLEIKRDSIILLSSNISKIVYNAAKNNEKFDADIFIDSFIDQIGNNGTLLITAYNWDFCSGIPFNYHTTQSKTGILGNYALKRKDFKRTKHPIYSHVVYGKDKDYLTSIDPVCSFGKDSVFDYLYKNNAINIGLDASLNDCYSTIYYFEQQCGVPYRYIKYFKNLYTDENNITSKKTYSMNVRYRESQAEFDGTELYNKFLKNGAAKEYKINKSIHSVFYIQKTAQIIEDDIKNNQSAGFMKYKNQFSKEIKPKERMYNIISDLFNITRSLSGNGNRQTLNYLKENYLGELDIKEFSIENNPTVFDWNTPEEWNINSAFIEDEKGNKIIDFSENNLHIVGYSETVDTIMTFKELDNYLYSLENDIEAIPYITSYYKKRWGFCLTHKQREELRKNPDKKYHVFIDSSFNKKGAITYGELVINGYTDDEILISTYICHPSMANDNLSGIAVAAEIAKHIYSMPERKYTYRIIFIPETIGSLIYLKENINHLQQWTKAGFVLSCIGDDGDYSCVHTPYNDTYTDKIVTHVLKHINNISDNNKHEIKEYSYLERGSDERQFCAPLVNLPVCTLCRTKFGKFKEYHTSNDNLNFISQEGLQGGLEMLKQALFILENNGYYKINTTGEPQLGKYGLYPTLSVKGSADFTRNLTNIIAYMNGKNSILDIAEILKMPFNEVLDILIKLKNNSLVTNNH